MEIDGQQYRPPISTFSHYPIIPFSIISLFPLFHYSIISLFHYFHFLIISFFHYFVYPTFSMKPPTPPGTKGGTLEIERDHLYTKRERF